MTHHCSIPTGSRGHHPRHGPLMSDLPGARWPGCSEPCVPRPHRPTPGSRELGPASHPRNRMQQRLPPTTGQAGTSVMAIFFLSKDSRICCSSLWMGRSSVGTGTCSLLPQATPLSPGPTWDCRTKDSFPGQSSCRNSCTGALCSRGRVADSGDCGKGPGSCPRLWTAGGAAAWV